MKGCFVPNCEVSFRGSKEKRHFFKAKPHMYETWSRLIPRKDKSVDEKTIICHVHFDERYILKTWDHIINGEKVSIQRCKWTLAKDAVPSLFPSCPKYFSKRIPKERSDPIERKQRAAAVAARLPPKAPRNRRAKSDVSSGAANDAGLLSQTSTAGVAPKLLTAVVKLHRLPGTTTTETTKTTTMTLTSPLPVPCLPLKPTPDPQVVFLKRKLTNINCRYNKMKRKMVRFRSELKAMKKQAKDNSIQVKSVSMEDMNCLTERQRNVVKHMVLSLKRKKVAYRFDHTWMNDCLILRTRSISEYEYLRKNGFLPLPSSKTLSRYVKLNDAEFELDKLFESLKDSRLTKKIKMNDESLSKEIENHLAEDIPSNI